MPRFRYSGKTLNGEQVAGDMTALNRAVLESDLMRRGIFVEDVRPALTRFQTVVTQAFYGGEVTHTTRQLGMLLESRIGVSEALELAVDQIKHQPLKTLLIDIRLQIESGRNVAEAFRDYPSIFDPSYTAMLEAGDSAAQLDLAFDRIATYRENRETLIKKVRSALTYPLLVLIVAILVVIALLTYVVPVFASMYANFGTQLPGLTQIIVDLSEFVRNYAGYTALCLFGFLLLVPLSLHSRTIKLMLHKLPLKLPGIRVIYLKHLSARFSRTIGSLLTAGVEIVYAFNIATQVVGNLALGRRFEVATDAIISGSSLAKALEGMDIFPKTLLRLCGSGEKSGQLGNMLTKAADYFEKETENDLTLLTTLLEPIILLLLGALIAFLLIAMYLPMFELIGTL